MTNKETVERNIGLTFDFVSYLIDNPSIAETLSDSFKMEFIEKDFPRIEKNENLLTKGKSNRKYVRVRNTFEVKK